MAAGGTRIHTVVDNYEVFLGRRLGGGTYGTVYLGRDRRTNDNVAIKYIEPPIMNRERIVQYMQSELNNLKKIDHPNVVYLIHHKKIGHCMYLILECCECDLQKFACENNVFEELKFDFIQGIAEGLNCLHDHRIIHRDIKPENVLVKEARGKQIAKLTDLGLSRLVPEGQTTSFSATPGMGTRQWMAPEVFADERGHARYSMPADIYSFGLLSWSVIVHRPGEFLYPLPELTGGEDSAEVKEMKGIIERMIYPQASQRYKAQEVCNAIRSIVDGSFIIPAEAHKIPPATGLNAAQDGSHVHLSDVESHTAPTGLGSAAFSNIAQACSHLHQSDVKDRTAPTGLCSVALSSVRHLTPDALDAPTGLLSAGSLAQQPQQPEPQKVDSTRQVNTISPLPLPGPPDMSRESLNPNDAMKQHDASHQLQPVCESAPAEPWTMQKEVSSMQQQIQALSSNPASTSGMQMEPTPTSAVQTGTISTPTMQAGQIPDPLMQAEPTGTTTQQMELASTTAMELERTPLLTSNRQPSLVSAVSMQIETPQPHSQDLMMQHQPRQQYLRQGFMQTELSGPAAHAYTLNPTMQTIAPQRYALDPQTHALDPVMQPKICHNDYASRPIMPAEPPLARVQYSTMPTKASPSNTQASFIPSTDQFYPAQMTGPTMQQVPYPVYSVTRPYPSMPRASTTILQEPYPHLAKSHVQVPMGYTMPPWLGTTNPQVTLPPGHSTPLPIPPHNSFMQQPIYAPSVLGSHQQRTLSVNIPRSQRAAAEKVKLRVLSLFSFPLNLPLYGSSGPQLDLLFSTADNQTVMKYYQFRGGCISEVHRWTIPRGHRYDCVKFITQQYIILQSLKNQVSFYNHDLQLIKTLSCPGWVIEVIGELYAVVESITTHQGLSVVTMYITSLTNLQEIHHELESPHPKAYDAGALLIARGCLDGCVVIIQMKGQFVDFYSVTGNHIQRADLDGEAGPPSCTTQHVLVPMRNQPQTILVFTWTGKLVQHLDLGRGLYDTCLNISPVHEGKVNVLVMNVSENIYKVITCEIQEREDENDEAMNDG